MRNKTFAYFLKVIFKQTIFSYLSPFLERSLRSHGVSSNCTSVALTFPHSIMKPQDHSSCFRYDGICCNNFHFLHPCQKRRKHSISNPFYLPQWILLILTYPQVDNSLCLVFYAIFTTSSFGDSQISTGKLGT